MAITKKKKEEIVTKLEAGLKSAESAVFVGFTALTVADETAMRRDLRNEGVKYTVAKKTLIRRALDTLGLAHTTLPMEGEVAVAYASTGSDASAPARMIHEFGKKWAGKLSILGGIFEGNLKSAAEMNEIATIPSMEILRGMFANVLNAPIAGLAVALQAVADKKQG